MSVAVNSKPRITSACTEAGYHVTTQVESVAQSHIRSALFGSGDWNPHVDHILQRFRERVKAFQDALGGTIDLRRLNAEETFRDLILAVTGSDFPARLPVNAASA